MNKKIIALLAISFIAIIIITVILLAIFYKPSVSQTTPPQTVVDAGTIIKTFNQKVTAGTLLANGNYILTNSKTQPGMYIKDSAIDKYLQVPAKDNVTIRSTNPLSQDVVTKITHDIAQFLERQGLSSVATISQPTILSSHASKDTTCQLETLSTPQDPTTQLRLSCTDNSANKDTISTVNQLVKLWSASATTHYNSLSQVTTTQGDYTIAILYALPADMSSSHILIYVRSADMWTYIGDASEGESLIPNDKYVINKDIKAALDNPQYGHFLRQVLGDATK
jgi:hypothetical protein